MNESQDCTSDKDATPGFKDRADNSSNDRSNNESYTNISNAQHITDGASNGIDASKYEELQKSRVSIQIDIEMLDGIHRHNEQRMNKLEESIETTR